MGLWSRKEKLDELAALLDSVCLVGRAGTIARISDGIREASYLTVLICCWASRRFTMASKVEAKWLMVSGKKEAVSRLKIGKAAVCLQSGKSKPEQIG